MGSDGDFVSKEDAIVQRARQVLQGATGCHPEMLASFEELLNNFEKLNRKLGAMMRISDKQQLKINNTNHALMEIKEQLEIRNDFIRNAFGRYVSDEVVHSLLDSPEGLNMGGEKREVTILMSDMRGFSAISDTLSPEQVMGMLNIYLDELTDVIEAHQGTIDAFIGDGVLVVFGAPVHRPDHPQQAVACAVAMQLAMERVNRRNREAGYPEIAMGIGLNTGSVVMGNIGNQKRCKFTVIGMNVVHASRIESCTIGGQILISESTRHRCGDLLTINQTLNVMPKGYKESIVIYEVGGIGGSYNVFLPAPVPVEICPLAPPRMVRCAVIQDKQVDDLLWPARILGVGDKLFRLHTGQPLTPLLNLKILLTEEGNDRVELFGKVLKQEEPEGDVYLVALTHIPPLAEAWLAALGSVNTILA